MDTSESTMIRIGVSSCLLGNQVRFDGGHKHDRYITDTLGNYFEFGYFCTTPRKGAFQPLGILNISDCNPAKTLMISFMSIGSVFLVNS